MEAGEGRRGCTELAMVEEHRDVTRNWLKFFEDLPCYLRISRGFLIIVSVRKCIEVCAQGTDSMAISMVGRAAYSVQLSMSRLLSVTAYCRMQGATFSFSL